MWLLRTNDATIHYFRVPEDVPNAYAILSHVWSTDTNDREMTFQELEKHLKSCAQSGVSSRDTLRSAKLKGVLAFAEQDGYEWLWADMCCIDKTSSAELSEAINSMYDYYAKSDVCYAYLDDVPQDARSTDRRAAIPFGLTLTTSCSRWFDRGWTLQELLAPATVIFLAHDFTLLGDRVGLALAIEKRTRIRRPILYMEEDVKTASVAQRMSWAADRETTRTEDRAYSLMGIFGIHMTPIYGEGEIAFTRLQEEILRTTIDMSLFAWGSAYEEPIQLNVGTSLTDLDTDIVDATSRSCVYHNVYNDYLLPRSTNDFKHSSDCVSRVLHVEPLEPYAVSIP
ncbi:HET-domain-containing protein [Epithele typhae]|uniref:HET-domain-containing protein n=1 Tax=Epithele typhae TaxID=378194 RepID=UPI0020073289|nr:HET-domain-containing protein [Epithele typhae]KAH9942130.1 HET-domain-containing protein [Epithele typhae]